MIRRVLVAAALALACGNDGPEQLRVDPPAVELEPKAQALFSATPAPAVTWSVREAGGGSVTEGGVYTAPSTPGVYHVVATAGGVSGEATVTVKLPITIAAPSTATTSACDPLQLTATVSGATDTGVLWTMDPACGAISESGEFRSLRVKGTCPATAQARADPSVYAVTTITVTEERVISVVVAPASVLLLPEGTVPFTARVTTSCGTFLAGT